MFFSPTFALVQWESSNHSACLCLPTLTCLSTFEIRHIRLFKPSESRHEETLFQTLTHTQQQSRRYLNYEQRIALVLVTNISHTEENSAKMFWLSPIFNLYF